MTKTKLFPFIFLGLLLTSCCNCKDTVKENFRYEEAEMTRRSDGEGIYFAVSFKRLAPAVQAAGMARCDCEALVLESPLRDIRFIRTDTDGSKGENISHRFVGRNYSGDSGSLYKPIPALIAEFQREFTYNQQMNNEIIFADKERNAARPVVFYAEFEFENGQLLTTETLTSL